MQNQFYKTFDVCEILSRIRYQYIYLIYLLYLFYLFNRNKNKKNKKIT